MREPNMHISILRDERDTQLRFVVWREERGDLYALVPIQIENGEAVWGWTLVEEGAPPPPTFLLPFVLYKGGLLQRLVDAIAEETGVVAKSVAESHSLLSLQTAHLADLQRLLFQSDYVEVQRGAPLVKEEENATN